MPLLRRLWRLHEGPVEHDGRFYRAARPADRAAARAATARTSRSTWRASTRAWSRPRAPSATGSSATRCSRPKYVREVVRPALARGAERTGREAPADRRLHHLLGRRGPRRRAAGRRRDHRLQLDRQDLPRDPSRSAASRREADAIREAWSRGDCEAMVAAVTDEMIDSIALAGTPDEVRERFAERWDGRLRAHAALAAGVPRRGGRARRDRRLPRYLSADQASSFAFCAANSSSVRMPCWCSCPSSLSCSIGSGAAAPRAAGGGAAWGAPPGTPARPRLALPRFGLAPAHAVRDGGRGPGDDGDAGHSTKQSWHGSLLSHDATSAASRASRVSITSCTGMRSKAIGTPPLRRTAAMNGAAQRFS